MTYQPLVAGKENRIQHSLVEEEIAHPFTDDHIHFVHRQGDLFDLASDERDAITQTVILGDLLGLFNDRRVINLPAPHDQSPAQDLPVPPRERTYRVHMSRATLRRKETQNTCTATNIQHLALHYQHPPQGPREGEGGTHDLVFDKMRVVHDRIAIRTSAHFILEHFLSGGDHRVS